MKREVHYCDACNAEMTWIDAALDVLRSVKQEVETTIVIGDEIGMRDGLTQILKQLDAALGITT